MGHDRNTINNLWTISTSYSWARCARNRRLRVRNTLATPPRARQLHLRSRTRLRLAGAAGSCHVWTAPAVQGKNLTFPRSVRVQPCIRPVFEWRTGLHHDAAVVAAGPDVIQRPTGQGCSRPRQTDRCYGSGRFGEGHLMAQRRREKRLTDAWRTAERARGQCFFS